MKGKIAQVSVVGTVVVLLCVSSLQAALTEWFDGFESGSFGPEWTQNCGRIRTTSHAYEGNHTMYTCAMNGKYAYRSIGTPEDPFIITFGINSDSIGSGMATSHAYQYAMVQPSFSWSSNYQAGIYIEGIKNQGITLHAIGGSNSMAINHWTWYSVKLVIRPGAQTYDVYVNDQLFEANIPFQVSGTPTVFSYVHRWNDDDMFVDIDAINVAVPEPATVGLVTLGLGFLFRKK